MYDKYMVNNVFLMDVQLVIGLPQKWMVYKGKSIYKPNEEMRGDIY